MSSDDTSHRVGVYGWSPGDGGVHRHRIREPLRVLASNGDVAFWGETLDNEILGRVDTVLAHTLHTETATEVWQHLARKESHRLVIDIDDAMWVPDWQVFRDHYTPDVLARLYDNMRVAHVVTCTTAPLAEHLGKINENVHVVPNTVPESLLTLLAPAEKYRLPWILGYQGSPSHARDWTPTVQHHVGRFLVRRPDWAINLYGSNQPAANLHPRIRHIPWIADEESYYAAIASMDIGIGPLRNTPFNRAKSSLRAVEYAALGVVAVLPDLPPYRGWVEDGVTGRLVGSHQTLSGVLAEVAADLDHMIAMGVSARQRAAQWTTEACIERWVTAWESR